MLTKKLVLSITAALLSLPVAAEYGHAPLAMSGLIPLEKVDGLVLDELSIVMSGDKVKTTYVATNSTDKDVVLPVKFDVPRYFGAGPSAAKGGVPLGNKLVYYGEPKPVNLPDPGCHAPKKGKKPTASKVKSCLAAHDKRISAAKDAALRAARKTLPLQVGVKAYDCGYPQEPAANCTDITDELKKLKLSDDQIAYYNGGPPPSNTLRKKVLPSMNEEQADVLAGKGAVDVLGSSDEWPNLPGHWGVDLTYRWSVSIPAGKTRKFTHEYKPFVAEGDKGEGHTSATLRKEYCAGDRAVRQWKRISEGEPEYLDGYRYADTTGLALALGDFSEWGKIGKLEVAVEHAKEDLFLSCYKGFKLAKPGRSVSLAHAVVPSSSVNVLLLRAFPKEPDNYMPDNYMSGMPGMPMPGMPPMQGMPQMALPVMPAPQPPRPVTGPGVPPAGPLHPPGPTPPR